jgi:XTP/dITP diphosphohydrolase
MEFVLATNNQGKLREFRAVLYDHQILSFQDINLELDIIEDGATYEENAIKKAVEAWRRCKKPVLADDSGIEIDYLDGKPGMYTARFLGEATPFLLKIEKILELMRDVPTELRGARMVCAVAAAYSETDIFCTRAAVNGRVADKIHKDNGFGFDPVFIYPALDQTFSELPEHVKNSVSPRGKALQHLREYITHTRR